ncbi:hypothetical protein GGX14DRAFT_417388 [Mycena pura]|uniref:MYND-type domain-containing protein n=1 Tax=Mycena pura TaxID=153505 RepID=A0AAD6YQP6_9AGAR|nr:hypothetical protein GGX14DRAFT_417388 [Mycena pura]
MDVFNPSCPHCVAEKVNATLKAEAPPAPCHRHAMSDRSETMRKELTQCQHCWKSKGDGVSLRKCAACKVDLYCSKQCQRSAWKSHKAKCLLNQRNLPVAQMDALKDLRSFTSKHRPTIAEAGIRALGVLADPSRAEQDVLMILLRRRMDSKRVETSFFVTSAIVAPLDSFPTAQEMRGQLKQASEDNKRSGMAGAIFVLLMDTDSAAVNVAPVGFPKASTSLLSPLGTSWQEWLTTRLNEGIVV